MAGQDKKTTEAKARQAREAKATATAEGKAFRVREALDRAEQDGGAVTVRGIARAAGVDRSFIVRRPDLRDPIMERERRGMSGEDVRRTRGGVPLSDSELDLTDRAARLAGMPLAAYWREVILEAAAADLDADPDDLDTARRPARRRRNYSERQQANGKQREDDGR